MEKDTVVITGAGSGLGASLAVKYSSIGSHVCLLGRTREKLVETSLKLENDCSIYEVDVTSRESVQRVMSNIIKERGTIDYLINNAGIGIFKLAEEIEEVEVDQMIDTNLKGTIYSTQAVLGKMKEQDKGCIVNIVSASGKEAKATESVYSASKFGVRGFSEAVALEVEDFNIQMLSAYMGNMDTELWKKEDLEKYGENYMDPDDVADIILDNLKKRKNTRVTDITILNHLT